MPILLDLFLTFAKVGVMTFGGGYAMLPILQREVVENKGWATEEELMDYFAIGQCTPGIIAVNTATFIGQKYKGNLGAIFTTLGVVFPSVVLGEGPKILTSPFPQLFLPGTVLLCPWAEDASGIQRCPSGDSPT